MDLEIKLEEICEFAQEIFLQNLLLATKIKNDLSEKGDLSGAEKIEKEVISVYEKMYEAMNIENLKKMEEENFSIEKIKKNINDILEKSSFTKEFIEERINLRKKLLGESGAEVVKNFYNYQLKECKLTLNNLIKEMDRILSIEEELNFKLSNEIQEKNQLKIVEKLRPIIKKSRILTQKIKKYNDKKIELEAILSKKWTYEMYGTINKSELLTTFLNFYGKK